MKNNQTIKNDSQEALTAISKDYNMFEAYIRGLAEELEDIPNAQNSLL